MKTESKKRLQTLFRSAGILLHVTSLPGRFGIGDLGPQAYAWIELLARHQQSWWQILPLNPTGEGNSPYCSFSAFAGNPLLISPELLVQDGLLLNRDLQTVSGNCHVVDYRRAGIEKRRVLDLALQHFLRKRHRLREAFAEFCEGQSVWLDYYALFMALRERFEAAPWVSWPKALVRREPLAMIEAERALAEEIKRHQFYQFLFHRQVVQLKRHARKNGVRLIGDLPIFVAAESADVWANPGLYLLDRQGKPKAVAGVPPDYFSKSGQRWGNPPYDWRAMEANHFVWWVDRLKQILMQVDLVRIDHFRGFAASWNIPADAPDARQGRWVKAPGKALFDRVEKELGSLPFIAEDLGMITDDVTELRDGFDLPGMRVLQFAFGGDASNPFLPHNFVRNAVAYTGTHDNDTTVGWFKSLSAKERRQVQKYAPDVRTDPAWGLIRLAWSSIANLAIVPLQDVMGLGAKTRMNTPGESEGNWRWRLDKLASAEPGLERLAEMTEVFGRAKN